MLFRSNNIIKALENLNQKPDFLSFYAFPLTNPTERQIQQKQIINPDYLKERLSLIKSIIGETRLKNVPLIVSEWNLTSYNRNGINDSVFKGAYIIKNIIDCIGAVDSLGYWVGSDLYSDYIEDNALIIGASGLLSKNGIVKPSWHAFAFMNALGPIVFSKDNHHLATGDGQKCWTIVCHNLKTLNHYYLVLPEEKVDSDEIPKMLIDSKPLHLLFKLNVPDEKTYRVKIHSINHHFGSVQDEWAKMNRPEQLDQEDIDYLLDICVPDIKIQKISSKQGQIQIGTLLEANEFQLIQIVLSDSSVPV